jgi:hypothetical protein
VVMRPFTLSGLAASASPAAWRCWRRCVGLHPGSVACRWCGGPADPRNTRRRGLPIVVTDNEAGLGLFDCPWRREATGISSHRTRRTNKRTLSGSRISKRAIAVACASSSSAAYTTPRKRPVALSWMTSQAIGFGSLRGMVTQHKRTAHQIGAERAGVESGSGSVTATVIGRAATEERLP